MEVGINKKGQAAMEFLMTYGWAILAAIIVVGVLWYMIGNPANLAGERFQINQPFIATPKPLLTTGVGATDTVEIEVRNGAGETVAVSDVTIENCGSDTTGYSIAQGDLETFTITCSTNYNSGDRLNGGVTITYTAGTSTLNQRSTGDVIGIFP